MSDSLGGNVKVVVRVRPWSEREKLNSIVPVVSANSERKEVNVIKEVYGRSTTKKTVYTFDEVSFFPCLFTMIIILLDSLPWIFTLVTGRIGGRLVNCVNSSPVNVAR
jgi:hypothetical protein